MNNNTASVSMQPTESVGDLHELAYTQGIRKRIIEELTKGALPDDKDTRSFLVKSLDGMDKAAIAKVRVKIEASSSTAQQETADLMAKILLKSHARLHTSHSISQGPVELDDSFILTDMVPGEMEQGVQTLNSGIFE